MTNIDDKDGVVNSLEALGDFKWWRLQNELPAAILKEIIFRWRGSNAKVDGDPAPWVPVDVDNPFRVAKTDNLARRMLQVANTSRQQLQANFGIAVDYDAGQIARLEAIADLADHRPLNVTPELIEWADH